MDLAGTPRSERKKAEPDIISPGVYRWPFVFRYLNLLNKIK